MKISGVYHAVSARPEPLSQILAAANIFDFLSNDDSVNARRGGKWPNPKAAKRTGSVPVQLYVPGQSVTILNDLPFSIRF